MKPDPRVGFGIRIRWGEPAGDLAHAQAFHDHFPEVEMMRDEIKAGDRVQFTCPQCGQWLASPAVGTGRAVSDQ